MAGGRRNHRNGDLSMKELLKVMLLLALVFAAIFVLMKLTGVLGLDEIEAWVSTTQQDSPEYLALLVVVLLFADLVFAIPTMTVSLLAGYFLGWPLGAVATMGGFFLAGISGYLVSRRYGHWLLRRIYSDRGKLTVLQQAFEQHGPWMLLCCRALPILPEVCCCMAGATRMAFPRFAVWYGLGSAPYALITTYAGSVSTLGNPMPAIMTAILLSLSLWGIWYVMGSGKTVG